MLLTLIINCFLQILLSILALKVFLFWTYEHLKWEYWTLKTRNSNLDISFSFLARYSKSMKQQVKMWIRFYITLEKIDLLSVYSYVILLPIPFWLFLDFVISMRNIIRRGNLSVQFHSCKSREMDRCRIYVFRLDLAKQWSKIGSLIA